MKIERTFLCGLAIVSALAASSAWASSATGNVALAGVDTAEMPRITQTVDNRAVTVLADTHVASLAKAKRMAAVDDATSLPHMQLILKSSATRAKALQSLIAAQHDHSSAKFHKWLTPEEFGENFGVLDADVDTLTAWLTSQGFKVNAIYPNRLQIDFTGTAAQVRQTFHTQINHYEIRNGRGATTETHLANDRDISVPTALADVVVGVAGLNDFHARPQSKTPQIAQYDRSAHLFNLAQPAVGDQKAQWDTRVRQAINGTGGVRGLVPDDLQTIYNTSALYRSGLTGKGITIAVVEDWGMVPTDWNNFVKQFSLGQYGGSYRQFEPQLMSSIGNCTDPGGETASLEGVETILDSEYATAMAPGAKIWVAMCSDDNTKNAFGGVYLAADNLINSTCPNDRPNIISVSYGLGEMYVDAASKSAVDLMWAQADAEGISVFVSSGDSGSNPSFNGGLIDVGVDANAFATSPNDTGVGGSDIADTLDGTTKQYFNSTPNALYGTAKSYVPELTWNESCGNSVAAQRLFNESALQVCKNELKEDGAVTSEGGSGGPSSVDAKPVWQRLVRGAAEDRSRDLPDVSLFAGSYGNSTLVVLCTDAQPCNDGFTTPVVMEGGTSLSSPMFAGIQALLDQGLLKAGALSANQGNAAPTLYALASDEYGANTGAAPATLGRCSSSEGMDDTGCVFHNITQGGNSANCIQYTAIAGTPVTNPRTPDCYIYGAGSFFQGVLVGNIGLTSLSTTSYVPAYAAQAGWSFANGLGSVNAANLLTAWKQFDWLD